MRKTFTRFRRWNRRHKFSHNFKRECDNRLAAGEMSQEEYDKAQEAAKNPEAMRRVVRELEVNEEALGGRIDWAAIGLWIKENWLQILKFVLTIAIMII